MRRLSTAAAMLLACLLIAAPAVARVVDRVAAVAGSEIITTFEVERLFSYEKQNLDPTLPPAQRLEAEAQVRNMILQVLVQDRLLDQEIERLGLTVSEREVDEALQDLVEQSGMRRSDLESALAAEGRTIVDLREQLSRRIKKERYVQYRLKGGVMVEDEEVLNYYNQHIDEFMRRPIVELGEIRINVPPEADEAAVSERYARAITVMQLVVAGEDFSQVARSFSDAPSAPDGGSLGTISDPSMLKQEYRDALKGLEPGRLSSIYRDERGFFFITVLNESSAGKVPFDEVEARVRRTLFNKAVDREMQRIDRELREKHHVEIKVDYLKLLHQDADD
ncbi:MAG: SurA N-terminal domain-containing protein [Candidatus Alcyoniella australis]|nr:SurA N-terminal domain-containing protein [Candidatus Alcyoniella australis]